MDSVRDIRIPKPRPRLLEKRDAQREQDREWDRVCAEILARDQRTCRCCERQGSYDVFGAQALHRHHLQFRSRGGMDTSRNLITVCAICHSLIHARQLWPIGTDANKRISFEIHEAAVIDVFGTRVLPKHVRIVTFGS